MPLDKLIVLGMDWISRQRTLFFPRGHELPAETRHKLEPFFSSELLDAVRIVDVEQIENPDFYSELEEAGYGIPLDFSRMAGITYIDTVILARCQGAHVSNMPLIFHECVHVAQYRVLGLAEFTKRYVLGWAENGFRYEAIPLERDAYQLQGRFEASPTAPFSVEAEVARKLA